MGALVSSKARIEHPSRWWGKCLYIGLTTGFCGSLTTFSGLSNQSSLLGVHREVTDYLLMLLVGFCVPYWALSTSVHAADALSSAPRPSSEQVNRAREEQGSVNDAPPQQEAEAPIEPVQPNPHPRPPRRFFAGIPTIPPPALSLFLSLFILGVFAMLILLASLDGHTRYYTLICIFAPFGTLIRWGLGRYNVRFPRFPLFTLLVNVSGSVFLALLNFGVCKMESLPPDASGYLIAGVGIGARTSTVVLSALSVGFCGCLTTVSSFANEVYHLKVHDSWAYALISIFGTQIVLLAVNVPTRDT